MATTNVRMETSRLGLFVARAHERLAAHPYLAPLRETRVWGLLAIRAYLAVVFFQAALGHLSVPPDVLAGQWAPQGPLGSLGAQVTADPAPFIYGVIALELALASSATLGLMTRLAGLGGFMLNLLFFVSFEWGDTSQLYLSWDASFAVLWFVVMVTAPGRNPSRFGPT